MSLYIVHGIVQTIALILLSVGLYYAIKRPEGWFFKHRAFMFSFYVLIFIGALIALYQTEWLSKKRPTLSMIHGIIGLTLLILVTMQVGWAIVVRKHVEGSTFLGLHRLLAGGIVMLAITSLILGLINMRRQGKEV